MRPFVKYVSLLLLSSGLIFSTYLSNYSKSPVATSTITKQAEAKQTGSAEKDHPQYFSFQQIIEFIVPALKK
ncbi:hypothetical protein D0C36_14495 [Mucilaginibacter conchicola]|uniref:Uncharacterized protein n=1 Tax=Mucilaginibacter conchicola TaxID=2303333 RepID=A0A372NU44_9SPHI|nr:hypothetical protein D0C36_14495 [Mucilaginibacter conchicola]